MEEKTDFPNIKTELTNGHLIFTIDFNFNERLGGMTIEESARLAEKYIGKPYVELQQETMALFMRHWVNYDPDHDFTDFDKVNDFNNRGDYCIEAWRS